MSESLVPIVVVFIFAAILNIMILSCICISIKRGKKLEILGTMDNFFYMKLIRLLLILSSIFLLIECIGFLVHYSFHNETTNTHFNTILITINLNLANMENERLYVSDFMIYFGFVLFLLCSVAAYYIALHRFVLTNRESKSTYDTQTCLHITCIVCYIVISLTAIVFSLINLFITLSPTLYYVLLICFDLQLLISSIPVLKSLKQVIEISRDSAKSVRWSVTNVSPSKLFYKMSVKAVRISMENIILNILLITDITFNLYQIIYIQTQTNMHINGVIPRNIHSAHLIILYFIQLFIMLWLNDYTWINRKYITVRKIAPHPAPKRHIHTRTNFSDFDYNNTVLKLTRAVTPEHPLSLIKDPEIVQLKAATESTPVPQKSVDSTDIHVFQRSDDLDDLQFLKLSSKIKLRSASMQSSTCDPRHKLNNEINKDGTKRRRSVLSRIPDAAKRMSRTFVENVISVDSIWDEQEQDIGDGTSRRWSRFNKPKPSKSPNKTRRHSMPTNVSPKTNARRNSVGVELEIPVFAPNAQLDGSNSPPICSPLSQLDTSVDNTAFKFAAKSSSLHSKLENITELTVHKVPPKKCKSLTLPTASSTATRYTVASPKTYSPRHPSTDSTLYTINTNTEAPTSLSDNSTITKGDSTHSSSTQIIVKRSKFFNYQPKLLLTDKNSNTESTSIPSLTPGISELSQISRMSDLSEIVPSKKQNGEIRGKYEEESKAKATVIKGRKGDMLTFMETYMDGKLQSHNYNIEPLTEAMEIDGIQSSVSPEPMNIVIAINDEAVNKSNTTAEEEEESENAIELHQDDENNNNALLNPVPILMSLEFDEEALDDILQCIDEYE